jgi:hypothetical protein
MRRPNNMREIAKAQKAATAAAGALGFNPGAGLGAGARAETTLGLVFER